MNLTAIYQDLGMMPPAVKVAIASDWAKELMAVVEAKKLYQLISNKKFLQAEAWELIGSFDECTAETRYEAIEEGGEIVGYKGIAVLMRRGERVGGGEGACYLDAAVTRGKQGRSRDRAAQSAAQTWAAAKALRIKYSYVAVLGGYEATPAEEMHDEAPERPAQGNAAPPRPNAPELHQRGRTPAAPASAPGRQQAPAPAKGNTAGMTADQLRAAQADNNVSGAGTGSSLVAKATQYLEAATTIDELAARWDQVIARKPTAAEETALRTVRTIRDHELWDREAVLNAALGEPLAEEQDAIPLPGAFGDGTIPGEAKPAELVL